MPDDPTHEEEEEEEEDNFQLSDDQIADFKDAFKKFDAAGESRRKKIRTDGLTDGGRDGWTDGQKNGRIN